MRTLSTVLLTSLLAASAFGQTIGNYTLFNNSSVLNNPAPFTVVDLNSPATTNGNIGAVTFYWNEACPAGAKVKFFRRSGNTFTMTAERGPFSVGGNTTVTLTPPVPVLEGDLIGITRLTECGGPVAYVPVLFEAALQVPGDITGSFNLGSGVETLLHFALALFGAPSADTEVRTQIIPVAGAAPGSGGAQFKTDVFMSCVTSSRCAGHLVFHPAGSSGSATDPSAAFDIPSNGSRTFLDLVGTTLGRSGLGSIDVMVRMNTTAPNVSARIYDDAGAAGTKGFTLEALRPSEALAPFFGAAVIATPPSGQYRMNFGVRTLDEPATVGYRLIGSDGLLRAARTRSYQGNFFEQVSVAQLLGVPSQPGDTIVLFATEGRVFAYGAIIDNTTNDPSVQVVKVLQ